MDRLEFPEFRFYETFTVPMDISNRTIQNTNQIENIDGSETESDR